MGHLLFDGVFNCLKGAWYDLYSVVLKVLVLIFPHQIFHLQSAQLQIGSDIRQSCSCCADVSLLHACVFRLCRIIFT